MKNIGQTARAFCLLALTAFTMQAQTISRINVTPSPAFAHSGGLPLQFHAIATYTNGSTQDVTTSVAWTIDNPNVATVSATGLATPATGASTTTPALVTATLGSLSVRAALNIETANPDIPAAIATLSTGTKPVAIGVNPITGKVFIANAGSNNVTVIDGNTYATTTVAAGTSPSGIAVNASTNKVYVANGGSNNVTVIDAATNTTTTVGAGVGPQAIAVNAATNKIYVANSNSLTVINGQTNSSSTIPAVPNVAAIAVNPLSNRIYVSYTGTPGILVFDGNTDTQIATVNLPPATLPLFLAANPAANQIYAGSPIGGFFTVIDGVTNLVTQPVTSSGAGAIAVNPVLNKVVLISKSVSVFDPVTATSIAGFAGDTISLYAAAAINPITNQTYVITSRTNTVGVLDGFNGYAMTSSITVGSNPIAVAVNPVKNKVFVLNQGDNSVTVIDGASNTPGALATGQLPQAVAVNPLTNKIYVANRASNDVTIVDGTTGASTSVAAGSLPIAIDVDPVANKIYAVNSGSNNVTVIDGVTNAATLVTVGASPFGLVVNPQTGRVYIANSGDNTVTVLNGATLGTSTVMVRPLTGHEPFFRIGLNPVTNKIYLPVAQSGVVTVIDGATNATSDITIGGNPESVAVNTATNQIYATNVTNTVTVIDGGTNLTTNVPLSFTPHDIAVNSLTNRAFALGGDTTGLIAVIEGALLDSTVRLPLSNVTTVLAIDPVTNKIFAGSFSGTPNNAVISLDGETNSPILTGDTSKTAVTRAIALAVNPATNRVYVVSPSQASGAFFSEEAKHDSSVQIAVNALLGQHTSNSTPGFTLSVQGTPVENVLYRFDTRAGDWSIATRNNDGTFNATPFAPLQPGLHVLLAFTSSSLDSTLTGTGAGTGNSESPVTSAIVSYPFYITAGATTGPSLTSIVVTGPVTHIVAGGMAMFTATAFFSDGTQQNITNQASWSSSNPAVASISQVGLATTAAAGSATITATWNGLSGTGSLVVDNPILLVTASPALSAVNNVGWVAALTLTNGGNVTITNVQATIALLNNMLPATTPPMLTSPLAPGMTESYAITFPASAGISGTRTTLMVRATYTAILPNGSTQAGTFTSSFRIVLP